MRTFKLNFKYSASCAPRYEQQVCIIKYLQNKTSRIEYNGDFGRIFNCAFVHCFCFLLQEYGPKHGNSLKSIQIRKPIFKKMWNK